MAVGLLNKQVKMYYELLHNPVFGVDDLDVEKYYLYIMVERGK